MSYSSDQRFGEVTAHEFGHALDDVVDGLRDDVIEHYKKITTESDGKTRAPLTKIPDTEDEFYRPVAPQFLDRKLNDDVYSVDASVYALKTYYFDFNSKVYDLNTELSSMFFQRLYQNIARYRENHTRHFHTMLEIYRDNATKNGAPNGV